MICWMLYRRQTWHRIAGYFFNKMRCLQLGTNVNRELPIFLMCLWNVSKSIEQMQINSSESFPHLETNTTSARLSLICPISHCDSDSAASTTSKDHREATKNRIGVERHNVNSQLRCTPRCAVGCAIAVVARVAHRLLLSL